jgi:hypothetical protein
MQKVYLLLRSNKQTGPYSLEELLQLNLKPFDLVWMEGRSAAWQYPSEIPSLKPYVPETPHADAPFKPIATSVMEEKLTQQADPNSQQVNPNPYSQPQNPIPQKTEAPKRVFVSVPKTYTQANEQKTFATQNSYAEHRAYMPPVEMPVVEKKIEVKQEIPSYAQASSSYRHQTAVGEEEEVHTNYSRSLNDVEEDYTNWVYKQKTKKKASINPKDLVLAVLILAVIGGGYYVMSKPSVANSVLPTNKTTSQSIQQPAENTTGNSGETEPKEILSPEQRMNPTANNVQTSAQTNNKPGKQAKTIKTKNPLIVSKGQTSSSVPSSQNPMPVEKTTPNIHDNNEVVINEPPVKQQPKENATEKKKEKFGDVIKGIFSKKDRRDETKNDQVVLEDPKPSTNRQATRRDADDNSSTDNTSSNQISTSELMQQVDLTSNSPGSWMLGVKNFKITLRNRSNVTIQTASVLVNYYNENNDLLEKKLLYFNNVAPKSKATVPAPDSKFADHVEFKLTTVSAKEDRYARY